jgi:hypothetical protein
MASAPWIGSDVNKTPSSALRNFLNRIKLRIHKNVNYLDHIADDVLMAVVMVSAIFWGMTQCSLLKVKRTFRRHILPPSSGFKKRREKCREWTQILADRISTKALCCVHKFEQQNNITRIFEVFATVTVKNGVFWDVTPCCYCKNRRFGWTRRLLHQGDKNRWTRDKVSGK